MVSLIGEWSRESRDQQIRFGRAYFLDLQRVTRAERLADFYTPAERGMKCCQRMQADFILSARSFTHPACEVLMQPGE